MKNKTCPILATCLLAASSANAVDVNATAPGGAHSLFLKTDGSQWVVGHNNVGQLGDGTTTDKNMTARILDLNVTAVSAGHQHSLILKNDGSLWTFGVNDSGQLGDGTLAQRSVPVKVENADIGAISAGDAFSLYLKSNVWGGFNLRGVGENQFGQLGDGSTTDRNSSIFIDDNVTAVSAGGNYSFWLLSNGTLRAVGRNFSGQLGDQTRQDRSSPVNVVGGTNVTAIAAGHDHSLFIKNDNSLWGMGRNSEGQLGDGTTNDQDTSVQIDVNVTAVTAGFNHTLYIKTDGSLWAMGRNQYGQLGDGTTQDRISSVKVVASGVSAVSSSSSADHSFFIKTDGSLWAMGHNHKGQLGDGTTTDRSTPVLVSKALTLNKVGSGAVSGAGSYFAGETITVTATPDPSYLFMGWTGDLMSVSGSPAVTISDSMEINATFFQQAALQYIQDNPNLYSLYTEVEKNASAAAARAAGITEGNASGIAYVQANPSSYSLYTESEKNASDATNYASGQAAGITDGNASGIVYVQANPSSYNLYTETEKNASDAANYAIGQAAGIAEGKIAGRAEGLAAVQADMAAQGLSMVTYLNQIIAQPYTYNWYYQPEWGWLWTNEENFPFVYKAGSGETAGTWLYFSQLPDMPVSFYDYSLEQWVTPAE